MATSGGTVRREVRQSLAPASGPAPYLVVSTIEPRKNHLGILDAFDRVWPQCPDARLVIAGRAGWMYDEILRRIRRHPQFERQLIWFNDLTDTELDFCYRHARAVISASFAEGFGLPIVEALQHGRRVLASDIPVHREVGGDFCAYFDPHNATALADLVLRLEQHDASCPVRPPAQFVATDWRDSTCELIEKCLQLACRGDAASPAGRAA